MKKILGIGALNVDYIASRTKMQLLDAEAIGELTSSFELGTETPANKDLVEKHLSRASHVFDRYMGGSAFNVIQTVRAADPSALLGYVGVSCEELDEDIDFRSYLERNRIETDFVHIVPGQDPGICVSYIQDGERKLLTYPGCNVEWPNFVRNKSDTIAEYASRFEIVHITSLFDNDSPLLIAELVEKIKLLNPLVKVSFDPGYHWVNSKLEETLRIYQNSSYLFLNQAEFLILSKGTIFDDDMELAKRISRMIAPSSVIILQKKYDRIKVYFKVGDRLRCVEHKNIVLTEDEIEDATGAGDVFAGGFLLGTSVPGFELSDSIELGLRLVREKLRFSGTSKFSSFYTVFDNMIEQVCHRYSDSKFSEDRQKSALEAAGETFEKSIGLQRTDDCATLLYGGKQYTFTSTQAAILKFCFEAWEKGTPELKLETIREHVGFQSERIDAIFRSAGKQHPAWDNIIGRGSKKGSYRILIKSIHEFSGKAP